MTRSELDAFLAERGFEVMGIYDPHHSDRNKFCDVHIGAGRSSDLVKLRADLKAAMPSAEIVLTSVTNPDHEDMGKPAIIAATLLGIAGKTWSGSLCPPCRMMTSTWTNI